MLDRHDRALCTVYPCLKDALKRLEGEDDVDGGKPVVEPSWPVLAERRKKDRGLRDSRNLRLHLRDNDRLIRLELKKAVQLSLAAKLEVGCH